MSEERDGAAQQVAATVETRVSRLMTRDSSSGEDAFQLLAVHRLDDPHGGCAPRRAASPRPVAKAFECRIRDEVQLRHGHRPPSGPGPGRSRRALGRFARAPTGCALCIRSTILSLQNQAPEVHHPGQDEGQGHGRVAASDQPAHGEQEAGHGPEQERGLQAFMAPSLPNSCGQIRAESRDRQGRGTCLTPLTRLLTSRADGSRIAFLG